MSDTAGLRAQSDEQGDGVDLALVARIEGELDAVERALEQIDQGVYEGFTGLGASPAPAQPLDAASATPSDEPVDAQRSAPAPGETPHAPEPAPLRPEAADAPGPGAAAPGADGPSAYG